MVDAKMQRNPETSSGGKMVDPSEFRASDGPFSPLISKGCSFPSFRLHQQPSRWTAMPPRRACDVCYKRKIQCLIRTQGEPCDWCHTQSLTCTFDRIIPKDPNKRTTTDVVQELSQRVEALEEALQSALCTNMTVGGASPWSGRPYTEPSNINLETLPVATAPVQTPGLTSPELAAIATLTQITQSKPTYNLSRCQLGTNWYFKGIGILSARGRQWISEGSGQRVFLENFDIFERPVGFASRLSPLIFPEQPRVLPSMANCRQLVGIFLKSKTYAVFPILDSALLEGTIARAYNVEAVDLGRRASAEACIWATIALVSRITDVQYLSVEPNECIHEVNRLLTIVNGDTNLDSLQATLLLWAYQKMRGQCREASITFRSACHMICDLGGHYPLSPSVICPQHIPSFDDETKLHIRRLFWICYCFDKDVSLRRDKPPLLTSDYCDVSEYEKPSDQTSRYNQSRDVNLARIKESASRLLCTPRAFKDTESELLAHVRQIDDELEEWRLSIEPRYRPRLSILSSSSFSLPSSMSLEDHTYLINLQLDYLFTIINVHTLVRKCGNLEMDLPDDLHSVVHSSADLSIEASRSIFRILETVVDFWKEDSVWIVSHYAPMAAMPLFINILIHPLGHPADSDLHILSSIGNITRKIPVERISNEEIEHIQEISEFVMELVRLGHSAAWKAKRGERQHDLDFLHKT